MKVIGLGGSLINRGSPDIEYLRHFLLFITSNFVKSGKLTEPLLIVVGGGTITRRYQSALRGLTKTLSRQHPALTDLRASSEKLDRLGIVCTKLNATLVMFCLGGLAYNEILSRFEKRSIASGPKKIYVASGTRPGWSTDYVAFRWAVMLGVKYVTLASNIDFIYTKVSAKGELSGPVSTLRWPSYQAIISSQWHPGMKTPVDPVAARLGSRHNLKAAFVNGRNFTAFSRALAKKNFKGTLITS